MAVKEWLQRLRPKTPESVSTQEVQVPIPVEPSVLIDVAPYISVIDATKYGQQKNELKLRLDRTRSEITRALNTRREQAKKNKESRIGNDLYEADKANKQMFQMQSLAQASTGMVRLGATFAGSLALDKHFTTAIQYTSGLIKEGYRSDIHLSYLDIADCMHLEAYPGANLMSTITQGDEISPIAGFVFMMKASQLHTNPSYFQDAVATSMSRRQFEPYPQIVEHGLYNLGEGLEELLRVSNKDLAYNATHVSGDAKVAYQHLLAMKVRLQAQSQVYRDFLFPSLDSETADHDIYRSLIQEQLKNDSTRTRALRVLGITRVADFYEAYRMCEAHILPNDTTSDFYTFLMNVLASHVDKLTATSVERETETGAIERIVHHSALTLDDVGDVFTRNSKEVYTYTGFWSDYRQVVDDCSQNVRQFDEDITDAVRQLGNYYGFKVPHRCRVQVKGRQTQIDITYANNATKERIHLVFTMDGKNGASEFEWNILETPGYEPDDCADDEVGGSAVFIASQKLCIDILNVVLYQTAQARKNRISQQLGAVQQGTQARKSGIKNGDETYALRKGKPQRLSAQPLQARDEPIEIQVNYVPPLLYNPHAVINMIKDFGDDQAMILHKLEIYGRREIGVFYADEKPLESTINGCKLKRIRAGNYRILLIDNGGHWEVYDIDLRSKIYDKHHI